MASHLLDGMNPQQRAAVAAGSGPVLVLAGPGSGKTRVLTHRVAYLIGEMNVPPEAIVAVTFTNKAAGEMRARVQKTLAISDGHMRGLQIGTFHAICARLLRREGKNTPYGADYLIYDTDDQIAVVTQALNELNIDLKKYSPRSILNAISGAKNELIPPGEYPSVDYFGEIVSRVYRRYQAILLDNNALDFDDLLMQMVVLMRENDTLREKYQRMYEFVLVDEFQDTNTAQYELVKILGRPRDNLFVVGDEDQGIYAFRGADFRNVLRFRQDYPAAQVYLLEQNYRSTQMILDAARAVIDKNTHRTPKALFTNRVGGDKITVNEAYNEDFEARFVIEKIEELRDQLDLGYSDFAVMYRTNAQSRALEETCIREGVPYILIGGVGFYKRREVRDVLAYLRVVNNPNDKISFARIVNVPRRGIGQKSLADFQLWAAQQTQGYIDALDRLIRGEPTPLGGRPERLFAEFGQQLNKWRELAASGNLLNLFDTIVADIGYHLYLREISDTPEETNEREENVQELRGLVIRAQDAGISLTEFLAEQSLVADVDSIVEDSDVVTLLTLHAAKGLEYPVVFITGLEEGLLPHMRSFDDADGMAEERRLMYVGITRAKDRVFLTYAFRRAQYGSSNTNLPSRFLSDLPREVTTGLAPKITAAGDAARFREETRWDTSPTSSSTSRLSRDLANDKIKSKIVPFPGGALANLRFKSGQKVTHPRFGVGTVIESKKEGDDERVVVAFQDKQHGIKALYASFGLSLVE